MRNTSQLIEKDMTNRNENKPSKAIRVIKSALFTASIVPSLVGGALAHYSGSFRSDFFFITLFALFIGQAGGDYLYYYFTHRHSDPRDSHTKIFAGWEPFFTDLLPEKHGTLFAGIFCLLVDLAIGIFFFTQLGPTVIYLALAGGLIAIFFTPLMLRGLKESVIFVTFGPLCVTGMYFVLTNEISWTPIIASLPIGFFVTIVAYLKGAKIKTAVENGEEVVLSLKKFAIVSLAVLGYASLVFAVAMKVFPPSSLMAFITLPLIYSVVKVVGEKSSQVQKYLWSVVRAIVALALMGTLLSIDLFCI